MPPAAKTQVSTGKRVFCTSCLKPSEVGRRAMSVFCPHCKKRLILEDYRIKTYHAVRELFTCGNILVDKKGHVVAPIRVGNLTVKGRLQGPVIARGSVRITKTGSIHGDIEASSVRLDAGAQFDGFLRIGPVESDEQ